MKYLTHYIEEERTKLFKDFGAFFAFNQEQADKGIIKGVKYVSLGAGLYCPKVNVDNLISGLDRVGTDGMAKDIVENGKEGIIRRELSNFECYYTGDLTTALDVLEPYGFTDEEISKVYSDNYLEMTEDL